MKLTRAERLNIDKKQAEAMADPENLLMGAALNIQVSVAAFTADRWGLFTSPRGKAAWHRWRHVESTSGGTYGWWPICQEHVHQCIGPMESVPSPPKGEPVCRFCKKGGEAKWERTPQAMDWLFGAIT